MMRPRVTILEKGLLLIALPLLYQALFIGVLLKREYTQNEAQRLAVHVSEVTGQVDRIYRVMIEAQSSLRGYLISPEPSFSEAAERSFRAVDDEFEQMKKLVSDDPNQQERLRYIAARVAARRAWQEMMFSLAKDGHLEEALAKMRSGEGQLLMDSLREAIDRFRDSEEYRERGRREALRHSAAVQNWLLIGGLLVNIAIGAICAAVFSRGIIKRLAILTRNTGRLARGEQLGPRVWGSDEISELDANFHHLAGELAKARQKERVFQRVLERRNEELAAANRELDHKSQENEMFVYSVSHDLRSPLVNLQGFSKELGHIREDLGKLFGSSLDDAARERARVLVERGVGESIHYIQTAVKRLSIIIDALLRLSRAGRVEYHPQLVDLNAVFKCIIEAMQSTITERGAEIVLQDVPPVWGDPTAIEQVLANLIGNAINYLDPQRRGRIEVGWIEQSPPGMEKLRTYFVKDNGMGIADGYLPKLFTAFQRLHASAAPGEGIGLALARRMVERHGGRVWAESKEGEGSTFFVALPASDRDSPLSVAPRKESIRMLARAS